MTEVRSRKKKDRRFTQLSNTASFSVPSLCGFASWREIGARDAFSPQGAKAQRTEDCKGRKPKPWQQ
jgi:hypothetical protein